MGDPLSSAAIDKPECEEVDIPLGEPSATDAKPVAARASTSASADFTPTSVNTVASYGQLLRDPPPPYEDATLFDQVELKPNEAAGGPEASSSKPASPPTTVTVDDPVKHVEHSFIPGMSGGFVTYRVNTVTSLEAFAKPRPSVRRRFRDFVALHDTLKLTHRGYIIPPRPEKNTVEGQRATEEFVESRRASLQRYLNQLASHPVIGQSDEVRVFLEADGPLSASLDWQQLQPLQGSFLDGAARLPKQLIGQESAIPTVTESAQSAKQAGDLLRRLKEMQQAVRNDHIEAPRLDAEETAFREQKKELEELQERIADASKKAEKVVAKMEENGVVLGDLGLSLIKLSKYEDEEGAVLGQYTQQGAASKAIAADSKRVGTAALRLSRLAKLANEQTVAALEPLHNNLALCPAVLKALREREAQLLTVQALEADIGKKQKALDTLEEQSQRTFGNDVARSRKKDNLQNDLAALELSLDAAKAELRKIAGRNREELDRWQTERRAEFSTMQESFLKVETAFQERNLSVWKAVAEEF